MSQRNTPQTPSDADNLRRRSTADSPENHADPPQHHRRFPWRPSHNERLCGPHNPDIVVTEAPSPDTSQHFCHYTPKCFLAVYRGGQCGISARSTSSRYGEEGWHDGTTKTTIRAENELEANREANNYKFGFRKWKGPVTERPIKDRSDVVRELYSDLNIVKPSTEAGSVINFGNIIYVLLFGWWISLIYFLICPVMFLTICGASYGKLCWKLTCYFIWPFGKSIEKVSDGLRKCCVKFPNCEAIPEGDSEGSKEFDKVKESTPLLVSSPVPINIPAVASQPKILSNHWRRFSTYVWLILGFPPLAVVHSLACVLSWLLVFTIPVAKMNAKTLSTVLLMAPEDVQIQKREMVYGCKSKVLLCCYRAFNWYYYKYTVQGVNIFALSILLFSKDLLPLVMITLILGYTDKNNYYTSMEAKFTTAIMSIVPLSYFIGMGIASLSAQSNFAVGAVVNATFGSITEITFYITALIQGHNAGTKCLEEIVKAALTGTLLGCILFIPGICMVIGGIKHREQRFNSRSAGVSAALLFISVGGVFAPTLFSKAYGNNMVCEGCTNTAGNASTSFICKDCYYDTTKANQQWIIAHIEPLVYTIAVLLPAAYLIGLIFTLKTHTHIYDIQISDGQGGQGNGQCPQEGSSTSNQNSRLTVDHLPTDQACINANFVVACYSTKGHHVVHWSRWRALAALIITTLLLAACADLTTQNIKPIMAASSVSQYFISVTLLAMVPELPEIVNGIQFALQNNISLSLEVGSCIAVQVCMIQIPLLILFNAFYDVGFVLVFSDIHLWASIFSVILVNYIFMDGKSDYFQGTALVMVYLILLALYFFAPSPPSC